MMFDWLRSRVSPRWFRFLRAPVRFIHRVGHRVGLFGVDTFCVDFYGHAYQGRLHNSIDNHVYFYGAYEKHVLYFLRDMALQLGADITFIDIGANVGQHSLFMSRHVRQVCAFEPYPPVREQLEEKLHHNRVSNVTVFPVGLGDRDEKIGFFAPPEKNLGAGSFVTDYNQGEHYRDLPVFRGDDFLARERIPSASLIKIDVEGYEVEVLKGLRKTLHRDAPVVLFEFDRPSSKFAGLEDELRNLFPAGYTFFTFTAPRRADGKVSRAFRQRQRVTGDYALEPFDFQTREQQVLNIALPASVRLPGIDS